MAYQNKKLQRKRQREYYYRNCHTPEWKAKSRKNNQKHLKKLRLEVLTHYSNGNLQCECCKENSYEFLCIDHIDGGGNKHRKKIGGSGGFYLWLRKNGYPKGFRVLCHNCNHAYGAYGKCPHQMVE